MYRQSILAILVVGCLLLGSAEQLRGQDKDRKSISLERVFKHRDEKHPWSNPHFQCSPEVICDEKGSLRLVASTLIADETGSTDYRQTEFLSDKVWAKKIFVVPSAKVEDATLYVFDSPREIRFNG